MKNLFESTILIVDDTPENIDILVELLEDFDKRVAINGKDALETAWEDTPDLILLDIMMPEMDGYEVCKRLRKNTSTKDVPVIFLTAKTQKEDIVKGFEAGGQDYVTKPFDARELLERVKTQLELKAQRELLKSMNEILEERVKERTAQLDASNKQLDKANKDLQGLDTAKNNFLEMISHEIRTPLNGIVGAAYLLDEVMGDDNEFGEFVEMLKVSVDRLEKFSTTALVITQLQADNYDIYKETILVKKLINECLSRLNDFYEERGVKMASEFSDPYIEINADNKLLTRATESVIHNAIKYSPQGGLVRIKSYEKDHKTYIEVNDQGKGFSEDAMNNLFHTFGLGEAHYDQNIGLSLKAAKMIIEAHNGEIVVHNFPDSGVQVQLIFNKN